MINPLHPRPLAEVQTWRTIDLLPNSHIELNWDWTVLEMRTADLLVMHQALANWFEQSDQFSDFYALYLGDEHIVMSEHDLAELYQLVCESIKELPRRTIRWIDIQFKIIPLDSDRFIPTTHFSQN